jgi:hypothetical protein
MAWTTANITALKSAIGSGILHVSYADGKSITYKSTDEQLKALALMEGEVNAGTRQGYRVAAVNKGV